MMVGRRKRREFITLWLTEGRHCFWCRGAFGTNPQNHARPTVEHFFPKSKSGPDHTDNFVVAHKFCNNARGAQLPDEHEMRRFVATRGRAGIDNLRFYADRIEAEISSQASQANSTAVPVSKGAAVVLSGGVG